MLGEWALTADNLVGYEFMVRQWRSAKCWKILHKTYPNHYNRILVYKKRKEKEIKTILKITIKDMQKKNSKNPCNNGKLIRNYSQIHGMNLVKSYQERANYIYVRFPSLTREQSKT
ncbi:hypothetical protein ERO13_A01G190666v2 [Gossypium hirsutum]|nr:hypothetical protein ERO13_A01G190666v2 [Gossypium hirsutum]